MTRPFSTASVQLAATELSQTPPSVDAVLTRLQRLDQQIDADFSALHRDLDATRAALNNESLQREQLAQMTQQQSTVIAKLKQQILNLSQDTNAQLGSRRGKCHCEEKENGIKVHGNTCGKKIMFRGMSAEGLADVLMAREEAYRVQQILVDRLKRDNKELKQTYENLWNRYQAVYKGEEAKKLEHLSVKVERAGKVACDVVREVEKRMSSLRVDDEIDNEEHKLDEAGKELMKALQIQKDAHEKLRSTVLELTNELEGMQPKRLEEERLREALEQKVNDKETEIESLKRELNKVLAEYEAVKIAHTYSNAELSRIRAKDRAKTRLDRTRDDPSSHPHPHHHHHAHLRRHYLR